MEVDKIFCENDKEIFRSIIVYTRFCPRLRPLVI